MTQKIKIKIPKQWDQIEYVYQKVIQYIWLLIPLSFNFLKGLLVYVFHNADVKTKWGNAFKGPKIEKCLSMSMYDLLLTCETLKFELWPSDFSLFIICNCSSKIHICSLNFEIQIA